MGTAMLHGAMLHALPRVLCTGLNISSKWILPTGTFLVISPSIFVRFSKFKKSYSQQKEPVVSNMMVVVRTACLSSQVTTWRQIWNTDSGTPLSDSRHIQTHTPTHNAMWMSKLIRPSRQRCGVYTCNDHSIRYFKADNMATLMLSHV